MHPSHGMETEGSALLSVEQARQRVLVQLAPLSSEQIPLVDSLGRVLAAEIVAGMDLPPFSNSAMDGYAVRAVDVLEASPESPIELQVIGDIRAGLQPSQSLAALQCMRIMTGGVLPPGADAVIPVEDTDQPGAMAGVSVPASVSITRPASAGDYLRPAGLDVRAGARVLEAGRRLQPQHIGMLAALGISQPWVFRRPRVAVLSSGDELAEPHEALQPGQIHDANSYALSAAIVTAGAIPLRMGIIPDDRRAIASSLDQAVEAGTDLILSSAGVSMGAHDYVPQVVESQGSLSFWKVNVRPGKPLLSGEYRGIPFLGLPGNPVSALVTFELFARPAIDRLSGVPDRLRRTIPVRLASAIASDGRESYLRASVIWENGEYVAELAANQDSAALSSLLRADALVIVPAGVQRLEKGQLVQAWLLGGLPGDR